MATVMRLGDLWTKHRSGTMQPDSAETNDLFIFGVTDDSRDVRYVTIIREIAATL
jgi:hypothetical protein